MVERRLIVDGWKTEYEGIFDIQELYKLIDHWFREKAYTKHEIKSFQQVFKDGKFVEMEHEPYKKITDYAKYVINLSLKISNAKDKIIEKDGKKFYLNEGHVLVRINGFLETDYEGKWDKKPFFFFLRSIMDHFVYKVHTERFEGGLVEEINLLQSMIKGYLNLHRL